eukprot:XP_017451640.1 PREDICTED: uncharacterized protein LOC102557427 isoform X2 [Rattus norvegicus]
MHHTDNLAFRKRATLAPRLEGQEQPEPHQIQQRDGTTSPLLQREGQEQLEHRQILWNLMGLTWKMPCMIRKKAKYRRRRRLVREGSRRYLGRRGIQT